MKKTVLLFLVFPFLSFAQDDLLDEIDSEETNTEASATFKGLKIVNFESTKLVAKKELSFIVSHRFGSLENGIDNFFGLDEAVTRLNFAYGLTDNFNVSLSRSSFQKTYEGALKYNILKQKTNGFPFTLVGYNSLSINTTLTKEIYPLLKFKNRIGYTHQLIVARKLNSKLSLEFIPTVFHDNFVLDDNQENTQYALGFGGRYKIGKRWSFNADYGLHLNRSSTSPFKNPLSIGFDLETGGHVFQMHLSNSQAMNANGYLGQATGDWSDGDIYFGFNLSRRF